MLPVLPERGKASKPDDPITTSEYLTLLLAEIEGKIKPVPSLIGRLFQPNPFLKILKERKLR